MRTFVVTPPLPPPASTGGRCLLAAPAAPPARRRGSWRGAARQCAAWTGGVGGVTGAPQGFRGPRSGPSEKLGANNESRRRYLELAQATVRSLRLEDFPGCLIVVTPRGIRIRDWR